MRVESSAIELTRRERFWALTLAWFATVAVDFFFYGGVFTSMFQNDDPYLLTADQLFARIPAGYASFAIEVAALGWLLSRLQIHRWRAGAWVGATAGAVVGGALLVGLWSVVATSGALLVSWWLVLTLQMAAGGAVLGAVGTVPLRRVVRRVLLGAFVLIVGAVVLQNVLVG